MAFVTPVMLGRKEVLFNDTFNTFFLQLYGVGHMVKDHSDSERENPLPPLYELLPTNHTHTNTTAH